MDEHVSDIEEEPINPNNIFGDEKAEDDNNPTNDLNNEASDDIPNTSTAQAPAPKKPRSINRHPNLNEKYLLSGIGEQTIYKVNSYFEDIKFSKGTNSEEKNLNKILRRYEYFAQQCYPKLCFQDFVEKVEKLSKKKGIKGALLTIRRENNDDQVNSEDEGSNENRADNNQTEGISRNDLFDVFPNSPVEQNNSNDHTEINKENIDNQSQNNNDQNEEVSSQKPQTVISEEMREIMLKKRLEAIEKRKRKLEEQAASQSQSQQTENIQ